MKVQYCYFGLVDFNENETLIDALYALQTLILRYSNKNQIHGVFYYANQSFFHCIEGEEDIIKQIFVDIKNLNILKSTVDIQKTYDPDQSIYANCRWSMRYVTKESYIFSFFKKRNFTKFQPLDLESSDHKELVNTIEAQYIIKNKPSNKKGYKVRGYNKCL